MLLGKAPQSISGDCSDLNEKPYDNGGEAEVLPLNSEKKNKVKVLMRRNVGKANDQTKKRL